MTGFWDEPPGRQRVRMVFREDDEDGRFTVTGLEVVEGCSIEPEAPTEGYDTGQQSRRRWKVYGPTRLTALRSWDALDLEIEPGSQDWLRTTMTGPGQSWPDHTGAAHHAEALCSLTEG